MADDGGIVITPPRMHLWDLCAEAIAGVLQRPGRSLLTALGTLLGVATLVTVLGLTATASGQISKQFTELSSTMVTVEDTASDLDLAGDPFPQGSVERLRSVDGVVMAGVWWSAGQRQVSRLPAAESTRTDRFPVVSMSPAAVAVAHPQLAAGRLFDDLHNRRGERVAVIGSAVAGHFGVSHLDGRMAIFVDGVPFTVVGILSKVERHAELMLSVLVPEQTVRQLWGLPGRGEPMRVTVETRLGAAQTVAAQAAVALRPDAANRLKVMAPPDPRALREAVSTDLNTLFLVLTAICLLIGAVGIANTTLVSVLERVPEIGLRRALGARGIHISLQFLGESAVLGTMGGLVGTCLGITAVSAIAAIREWTAIVEPWTTLPAPLLGTITGLLAGLYPALRASRIQPIDALQR